MQRITRARKKENYLLIFNSMDKTKMPGSPECSKRMGWGGVWYWASVVSASALHLTPGKEEQPLQHGLAPSPRKPQQRRCGLWLLPQMYMAEKLAPSQLTSVDMSFWELCQEEEMAFVERLRET
ncbi:hypothetical protein Y1Q_0009399 [Alligator mississippiensis]|uniref:Uncharacterized protein n=1 Tax=Alligator mississippiensis TaxID=8496 RepID=A0A151N894_ALLMI|nr:hypothetical protein Y1Q_0009399 [Alligator mississippiensis]